MRIREGLQKLRSIILNMGKSLLHSLHTYLLAYLLTHVLRESASQLLQRFKDELLQRRIYASRDHSQQIAASASAIQEQLQTRERSASGSIRKKFSVTSGATDNRNAMSGKAGLDLMKSRKTGRAGAMKKLDYTIAYRPPHVDQRVLDSILHSVQSLNYKNRDTIGRDNRTKNALVRGDNNHDVPGNAHSLTTLLLTHSLIYLSTSMT